ncbi:hypothetical protein MBLNU230_g1370t1 [Neophaeotheca triangularis]
MADISSLGVHHPVALPYLINEGLLPRNLRPDSYQWETSVYETPYGDVQEEVLATKDCVVWSQGDFVRNVYRFEQEGENVVQALLTSFPDDRYGQDGQRGELEVPFSANGSTNLVSPSKPKYGTSRRDAVRQPVLDNQDSSKHGRALVVLLKTKAHIYTGTGARHIVNLPFEVQKAFASPRGVLLQRKIAPPPRAPTAKVPAVPPNSFLSAVPTSSYLDSPTVAKSFGTSHRQKPALPSADTKLSALFQNLSTASNEDSDEEAAGLYTLTSPLSEIGVVTYSHQHWKPRLSNRNPGGLNVEFEALDPAERVVYASHASELGRKRGNLGGELMLLVTMNYDLRTVTIWHAWYIEEKSLAALLRQKADQKAAKARRRSSFLSANLGTGATTPAARPRDGGRESLAVGGTKRLASDSQHTTRASSRRPTKKDEEEAMASQLDPDYQPGEPRRQTRDSRRISSLVSRGELSTADARASQTSAGASFGGAGGSRRNTSFGGAIGRSSLGRRKSRASTPGSTFSRSLGPEDDSMDLDSEFDADGEESIESVLRHIRATYDAAGAESILMNSTDVYKHELVVRKVHSMDLSNRLDTVGGDTNSTVPCKVAVFQSQRAQSTDQDTHMSLYLHYGANDPLTRLDLTIKHRSLWPTESRRLKVAIPVVMLETTTDPCDDIAALKDDQLRALLFSRKAILFSPQSNEICAIPTQVPYRFHDLSRNPLSMDHEDEEIGRNRVAQPPVTPLTLQHVGPHGSFDEIGSDGMHHRRQIKLSPHDKRLDGVLQLCEYVLTGHDPGLVRKAWCRAHDWLVRHPDAMAGTSYSTEHVAFLAAVFVYFIGSLDPKARASLRVSRMAVGKHRAGRATSQLSKGARNYIDSSSENAWAWMAEAPTGSTSSSPPARSSRAADSALKDQLLVIGAGLADELLTSVAGEESQWLTNNDDREARTICARKIMHSLHLFREEQKLNLLADDYTFLVPTIAQLGAWLGLEGWGYADGSYYDLEQPEDGKWVWIKGTLGADMRSDMLMEAPVGIYQWYEQCITGVPRPFLSLSDVVVLGDGSEPPTWLLKDAAQLTPRTAMLGSLLARTDGLQSKATRTVESMANHGVTRTMLETFPAAFALPFREAIARCEREPPTDWTNELLRLVGRSDLVRSGLVKHTTAIPSPTTGQATRDVQTILHALEQPVLATKTREAGRHAVSQLIFNEDRRLVEATSLMHFNSVQVAECAKQPDWTDTFHFEQQRRVMNWVTIRTTALPPGDAMIHYDSQTPLLTEKFHLSGFSSSCIMQPMGHTVTTDRTGLSEEKINWAFFHAGVSAGLRISRNSEGIDTSWVVFNKPEELKNRHAGLLLALGLGGHLRHLAKWLSFKYLTPKHTMTSVGLLLGLAASYMGTMDSLITRMLSVHITKMLPYGAAELNVSPATQTAGLMGIGLLYYNSQHRRMSEIMLSEIEYMDMGDPDDGPDLLRDESYRLAAGFALGLINLGKGKDLRGMHGMHLPERLLAMAVGPRPVHAVHVFDQATAGAVIAVALVYMKSGNKAVAQKINIPDTETQFDHVRPDILLLRTAAKHVILWDHVKAKGSDRGTSTWIQSQLPRCYQGRIKDMKNITYRTSSSDIPFYNIATGLAWALGLRYAGTGNTNAREEILSLLDTLYSQLQRGEAFYYDAKLARATLRRCIDVLALSAATVMAGTGDIITFRYLRRQHGRTNAETTYGSHMAAHLAIGVLFLGGGTYTFCTSDLAIASLMCAFYPLFPIDVQDNRCHLQALRHFWIFAADARCIVIQDIDTHRPIPMPLQVTLKDGTTRQMEAPCLLPELDTISQIETDDRAYWRVTLDFAFNAQHLAAFRKSQIVFVRRCPASEAHDTVFGATFAALNDARLHRDQGRAWDWILQLPAIKKLDLDIAAMELVLPPEPQSGLLLSDQGTIVDERLMLMRAVGDRFTRDELWNLRLLFAWAERHQEQGHSKEGGWLGYSFIQMLRAKVEERTQRYADEEN